MNKRLENILRAVGFGATLFASTPRLEAASTVGGVTVTAPEPPIQAEQDMQSDLAGLKSQYSVFVKHRKDGAVRATIMDPDGTGRDDKISKAILLNHPDANDYELMPDGNSANRIVVTYIHDGKLYKHILGGNYIPKKLTSDVIADHTWKREPPNAHGTPVPGRIVYLTTEGRDIKIVNPDGSVNTGKISALPPEKLSGIETSLDGSKMLLARTSYGGPSYSVFDFGTKTETTIKLQPDMHRRSPDFMNWFDLGNAVYGFRRSAKEGIALFVDNLGESTYRDSRGNIQHGSTYVDPDTGTLMPGTGPKRNPTDVARINTDVQYLLENKIAHSVKEAEERATRALERGNVRLPSGAMLGGVQLQNDMVLPGITPLPTSVPDRIFFDGYLHLGKEPEGIRMREVIPGDWNVLSASAPVGQDPKYMLFVANRDGAASLYVGKLNFDSNIKVYKLISAAEIGQGLGDIVGTPEFRKRDLNKP